MDSSHQSLATPSPLSRQSKVVLQRQYRANEGEYFNTLRAVINELTGEQLQTRQEILRKAIELLLAALEVKRSKEARVVRPTPYEMPTLADLTDATSTHTGYSVEPSSSHLPESWHSTVELDAQSAYYDPQSYGQTYPLMFNMDSTQSYSDYQGYGQDWSTSHF